LIPQEVKADTGDVIAEAVIRLRIGYRARMRGLGAESYQWQSVPIRAVVEHYMAKKLPTGYGCDAIPIGFCYPVF
jgi:hypothetical protein